MKESIPRQTRVPLAALFSAAWLPRFAAPSPLAALIALFFASTGQSPAAPIAKEYFDGYTDGALAGQGLAASGWTGPWAQQAGSLPWNVTGNGGADMNFTPSGGTTIATGAKKVRLDLTGSRASALPAVTRQLFTPQTDTFYAAIVLQFKGGSVNTGDMFGFYLGFDPAGMSTGINVGYRGAPQSENRYFFIRKGTGSPPVPTTPIGARNDQHYLVLKVEKDGSPNYNKVTLWTDPAADAESSLPNGNVQSTIDFGITTITQIGLWAQDFTQTTDGDEDIRIDSFAMATSFAELTAPAAEGPPNAIPHTIQVESLPDGTGTVVPAQDITSGDSLTVYSIWRDSGGTFVENGVATTWSNTDVTGDVQPSDLTPAGDGRSAIFTPSAAGTAKILASAPGATNLIPSGTLTALPASPPSRPFIWVRDEDRAAILSKIAGHSWASSVRDQIKARADAAVASHQADRDGYLRAIPADWALTVPAMKTIPAYSESTVRGPLESKLNNALDCAVLHYLTQDPAYASCAADILHNVVATLLPVAPNWSNTSNGGWVWQGDYLKEARVTGTQMPIIYDFLHDWLNGSNTVYEVATASIVVFNTADAQQVFRNLYQLGRDHGNTGSNWSALEATCIVNNALALDDPIERAAALQMAVHDGSSRQLSITGHYAYFLPDGNIWPESLQYTNGVSATMSYLMVLLDRYDPSFNLVGSLPNIPRSLPRTSYLAYPNGSEQISFGDGHRPGGSQPFFSYEIMYQHARENGVTEFEDFFGSLIAGGVEAGGRDRSVTSNYSSLGHHNEPLQLLWFAPTIEEPAASLDLPRTDTLPYAGIALQRNLPANDASEFGLMGFVGGAAHVHSHASGMSMELYGAGQVLGAKSGRTSYGETSNENYYRVFASNNTVIVNGSSRGEGGWKDLGMNTVQVEAMEPIAQQAAVSPDISFTCSSFNDNKGSGAEALQQRTLAIVRTSPTTGYYVDIFRSDSSLAGEFHDYIYRNVGDTLDLEESGAPLAMTSAPARFQSDIGDSKQQPGWRYFEEVEVGASSASLQARFTASQVPGATTSMDLHIPGEAGREYSRVTSPPIVDAPGTYDNDRAPTLVIRQDGEAWDRPFAVVYEPHRLGASGGSVKSVAKLTDAGVFVGLVVESEVAGQTIRQYVLSNPQPGDTYTNPALGLSLTGRFAVVTDHGGDDCTLYLGDASSLSYGNLAVSSQSGLNTQAHVVFRPGELPQVTANSAVDVTPPGERWNLTWFGDDWNNPAVSGDLVDFENDGLVNLLERALNGDPTRADAAALYQTLLLEGRLALTFERVLANSDLTITVQAGDDLSGTWTDLAESVNGGPFVPLLEGVQVSETGTGPTRSVAVSDQYLHSDPSHPQRFMRIGVSGPAE